MTLSRFVLSAALALGLGCGFLAAAPAQAHEVIHQAAAHREVNHQRHHRHFEVLYRCNPCESWRCFGRFDCREDAHCAAERLQHQGNYVLIRAD